MENVSTVEQNSAAKTAGTIEGTQQGEKNGISVKTDGIGDLLQDFNSARKSFIDYVRNNFPASIVNQSTNREIGISRKGIDKFLSGNITAEKFASGYEIPKLIETATKVGEAVDKKSRDNIVGYEYYYNTLTIDGKDYAAHIRVRNTGMGDRYYGHTVSKNVDDIQIEPLARTSDTDVSLHPVNEAKDSLDTTIPQAESVVNSQSMQNEENYAGTGVNTAELTQEEKGAILRYKSGGSYVFNGNLRRGKLSDIENNWKQTLNAGLDKMPVYDGVVYRNIGFQTLEDFEVFIAEHKAGNTVTYPSFTSSSKTESGYLLKDDVPYLVHYEMYSKNGRDIESIGLKTEQEVLFKTDSSFKIHSAVVDGNTLNLVVEEIGEYESIKTDDNRRIERSDIRRDNQSLVSERNEEFSYRDSVIRGGSDGVDSLVETEPRSDGGASERNVLPNHGQVDKYQEYDGNAEGLLLFSDSDRLHKEDRGETRKAYVKNQSVEEVTNNGEIRPFGEEGRDKQGTEKNYGAEEHVGLSDENDGTVDTVRGGSAGDDALSEPKSASNGGRDTPLSAGQGGAGLRSQNWDGSAEQRGLHLGLGGVEPSQIIGSVWKTLHPQVREQLQNANENFPGTIERFVRLLIDSHSQNGDISKYAGQFTDRGAAVITEIENVFRGAENAPFSMSENNRDTKSDKSIVYEEGLVSVSAMPSNTELDEIARSVILKHDNVELHGSEILSDVLLWYEGRNDLTVKEIKGDITSYYNGIMPDGAIELDLPYAEDIKFSIEHTVDNFPAVVIKENALAGVPKSEWVKRTKEAISEFSNGIPVSGRLIKVGRVTKNEYTNSRYTKMLKAEDGTIYADKLNAANNLDEIVLASTNYINEDLKHERKDNIKQFARGNVLLQVGENQYNANVIIGITKNNEMLLYDLVDLQPTEFTTKNRLSHTEQSVNQTLDRYDSTDKSDMSYAVPENQARVRDISDSIDNTISQVESVVNSQSMQNGINYAGKSGNLAELTQDEKGAILRYKSGGSYVFNGNLREGKLSDVENRQKQNLNAALDKMPVYEGIVYRNIGFGDLESFEKFIAEHKAGDVVTYPAFTSTSKTVDGYLLGDGAAYLAHYEILSKNGRDLQGVGNTLENEVLFKTGSCFEIRSINVDRNMVNLIVEEILGNDEVYKGVYQQYKHDGSNAGGMGIASDRTEFVGGNEKEIESVDTVRGRSAADDEAAHRETANVRRGTDRQDVQNGSGVRQQNRNAARLEGMLQRTVVDEDAQSADADLMVEEVTNNGEIRPFGEEGRDKQGTEKNYGAEEHIGLSDGKNGAMDTVRGGSAGDDALSEPKSASNGGRDIPLSAGQGGAGLRSQNWDGSAEQRGLHLGLGGVDTHEDGNSGVVEEVLESENDKNNNYGGTYDSDIRRDNQSPVSERNEEFSYRDAEISGGSDRTDSLAETEPRSNGGASERDVHTNYGQLQTRQKNDGNADRMAVSADSDGLYQNSRADKGEPVKNHVEGADGKSSAFSIVYEEGLVSVSAMPSNTELDEIARSVILKHDNVELHGSETLSDVLLWYEGRNDLTVKEIKGDITSYYNGIMPESAIELDLPYADDIKFSFAGEKAKNADKQALSMAKNMLREGKSAEEIFAETGWFKGKDGKWRFEIDDSSMGYKGKADKGRLKDFVRHYELFSNYPALKNVRVKYANLGEGRNGRYSKRENTIYLDKSLKNAPVKTVIHEIQHIIQGIEGFERGGNPNRVLRILRERTLNYLIDSGDEIFLGLRKKGNASVINNYIDNYIKRTYNVDTVERAAYQVYRSLYGEQEARQTAERLDMTERERRNNYPGIEEAFYFNEEDNAENRRLVSDKYQSAMDEQDASLEIQTRGEEIQRRDLGEQEARLTAERLDMGNAERRRNYPEYGERSVLRNDKNRKNSGMVQREDTTAISTSQNLDKVQNSAMDIGDRALVARDGLENRGAEERQQNYPEYGERSVLRNDKDTKNSKMVQDEDTGTFGVASAAYDVSNSDMVERMVARRGIENGEADGKSSAFSMRENNTMEVNGNGRGSLYSNRDGGRQAGENTAEQIGRLAEGTRSYQAGRTTAAERSVQTQNARDNGQIVQTPVTKWVRADVIQPEAYTPEMWALVDYNKRVYGADTILFSGNAQVAFHGGLKNVRGFRLSNGTIGVQYDNELYLPEQISKHEAAHNQSKTAEYEKVSKYIKNSLSVAEQEHIIYDLYERYYEIADGNEDYVWEEFICDVLAGMSEYSARYEDVINEFWGTEAVPAEIYNPATYAASLDAGGEVFESTLSFSKAFASEYDGWITKGGNYRKTLTVGRTSEALKSIGIADKKITWDTAKIAKIKQKHAVDDNIIKQIPEIIENPVIIMQSQQSDSRFTMFGQIYDMNGNPVVAVLEIEPKNSKGQIMLDEIKLVSAYGKNGVQPFINRSKILYVNPNKKITDNWLTQNRLQLPLGQTNYQYKNNISQKSDIVNTNIRKNGKNDTDGIRFSAEKNAATELKSKLQSAISSMQDDKAVVRLSGNEFNNTENGKLSEKVLNYFKNIGGKVYREGFGTVILNKVGIGDSISHGIGRAKAITFASVPHVIKLGRQIDFQQNWKGRGYDTYVFAAPVDIGIQRTYVAAIVSKKQGDGRYYLHEVLNENGDIIKKDDIAYSSSGLKSEIDLPEKQLSSSNSTLSQNKADVNTSIRENGGNDTDGDVFTVPASVSQKFAAQVDSWLNRTLPSSELLQLGSTPEVLKQLGANDLPVVMNQDILVKITGGKHNISLDEIKNLPQAITDPIMIFKSATVPNSFVILTELVDKSGNDIVAALHLNRSEGFNQVNRIASVYGKNNAVNFVQAQIKAGNLKYIDKNKSSEWLRSRGLQLPKLNTIQNSNNSILQKEDIVNTNIRKNGKNDTDGIRFSAEEDARSNDYNYLSEPVNKIKNDIENVRLKAESRKGKVYTREDVRLVTDSILDNIDVGMGKGIVLSPKDKTAVQILVNRALHARDKVQAEKQSRYITRYIAQNALAINAGDTWDYSGDIRFVLDHVRNSIMLTPDSKEALVSVFGEKSARGYAALFGGGSIGVDVIYDEMSAKRSDLFPSNITSEGDKMRRIAEVYSWLKEGTEQKIARLLDAMSSDDKHTFAVMVNHIISSALDTEGRTSHFSAELQKQRQKFDADKRRIEAKYKNRIADIRKAEREKANERIRKLKLTKKVNAEAQRQKTAEQQEQMRRMRDEERYSYQTLIQKSDMPVTKIDTGNLYAPDGKLDRKSIIERGIANVRSKNNSKNTESNAFVFVKDIGKNVMVTKDGLRHGLARGAENTAKVTVKIGDILENAIKINELIPRKNTLGGYVLLGIGTDGTHYYPVRVVVNNYSVDNIEVLDVLYAVNAKRRTSPQMRQGIVENSTPLIKGSSDTSIAEQNESVKGNFSETTEKKNQSSNEAGYR